MKGRIFKHETKVGM